MENKGPRVFFSVAHVGFRWFFHHPQTTSWLRWVRWGPNFGVRCSTVTHGGSTSSRAPAPHSPALARTNSAPWRRDFVLDFFVGKGKEIPTQWGFLGCLFLGSGKQKQALKHVLFFQLVILFRGKDAIILMNIIFQMGGSSSNCRWLNWTLHAEIWHFYVTTNLLKKKTGSSFLFISMGRLWACFAWLRPILVFFCILLETF